VQGAKCGCIIFHVRLGPVRIAQKAWGHVTPNLCFLHPVVFVSHVVYFSAPLVQNVTALIFILGWARCSYHKKRIRIRYVELVFSSGGIYGSRSAFRLCLECETSTHYFSFLGGPSVASIKSALGHVTRNLSFCIPWDPRVM
jgi:hypothetical protein